VYKNPVLTMIAAVADNGIIGKGNDLPWRLKSDLQRFKALTIDKPILMGSNTWDSLPRKPLPHRLNIVLSRDLKFQNDNKDTGAIVCNTIFEALELARDHAKEEGADEIMVIGGANLYAQMLPMSDRLYITHVHAKPAGDVYFPVINTSEWVETASEFHIKGDEDDYDYSFKTYQRLRA
jgi:dihydrofolate reductase